VQSYKIEIPKLKSQDSKENLKSQISRSKKEITNLKSQDPNKIQISNQKEIINRKYIML
jgi:hypothetical protein